MWTKRKTLIIATAVVGVLGAAIPALMALAGNTSSPFGQGNPFDNLQGEINRLNDRLQDALYPRPLTRLTGDYVAFANADCMMDGPAFGPGLTVNGSAENRHQTSVEMIHYNGDGTGTITIHGMNVSYNNVQGASPIFEFAGTCDIVSVVVKADGSFTQERGACTTISTFPDGRTTPTNTEGTVRSQGHIVNGGKMLFFAGIVPSAEESISPAGTRQKVCTRSSVATKIN
jgi:hypothetical protein